jgi:hypothetical protein
MPAASEVEYILAALGIFPTTISGASLNRRCCPVESDLRNLIAAFNELQKDRYDAG